MASHTKPATSLCRHNDEAIFYRQNNLVEDLMGRRSFTDVMFEHILGRAPAANEARMLDAVLVTLMEHGLTPSAVAARLIYMSSPENIQAGVSAGLLGVASRFIGTMEDCARLLESLAAAAEPGKAAQELAVRYREQQQAMPGFGHHLHKPDDPRAVKLLQLSQELGVAGPGLAMLKLLAQAVDQVAGRHITINATGATAAVLYDMQVPIAAMRGFAVISRAAGLVAHLLEEQQRPSGRFIWDLVDKSIPFESAKA
ncbi:MAG TPA: citryl-CoA lyase [Ramlibacter sp.]|nr:citryl-CoA lyase [Ramlibacter sp.]